MRYRLKINEKILWEAENWVQKAKPNVKVGDIFTLKHNFEKTLVFKEIGYYHAKEKFECITPVLPRLLPLRQ